MSKVQLPDIFNADPFDDMFRGFFRPVRWEGAPQAPQIKVDVEEDEKAFTVKAEIPGVKKEDIDVRVDGRQVTIAAEVKEDKEEKKEGRLLRSERRYGYASRSFLLDNEVDQAAVDAKYNNGVLELRLPKKTQPSARKITVG